MSEPEGWALVFDGGPMEATIVRAALDSVGFTVAGLEGAHEFPGLDFDQGRVFVPENEAEAARQLIDEARHR